MVEPRLVVNLRSTDENGELTCSALSFSVDCQNTLISAKSELEGTGNMGKLSQYVSYASTENTGSYPIALVTSSAKDAEILPT
jgi:hypothetical protein